MIIDRLVFGEDKFISDWVKERIPHMKDGSFGEHTAIGVLNKQETEIIAGVVYHDYLPQYRTIQLSMAADNPLWAKKDIIKSLLFYPFRQLNVYKVFTITPISNKIAIKVNEHIGFKREAVLAHSFGRKRHAVICRILSPEFKKLYEVNNG